MCLDYYVNVIYYNFKRKIISFEVLSSGDNVLPLPTGVNLTAETLL